MTVYSFASGPSAVPAEVLGALASDVEEWKGSGLSALELPFTADAFGEILFEAEQDIRALLDLPPHYRVLFLQGGASAHFALVPMNLLGSRRTCDYVVCGHWSRRAAAEATGWSDVRIIASGDGTFLPDPSSWRCSPGAAYCHFTSNETADGLQFHAFPETGDAPLIADMTADLFTRAVPVERFGLIYASAQKNLGAAGLTVVIVRDDLLGRARREIPAPFDYTRQAEAGSKVNTPPTFAVLVAHRMLRWLRENGGIAGAEARSKAKSAKVYATIGNNGFYRCLISPRDRSRVNVCFRLPRSTFETLFLTEAEAHGLLHLGGHRDVGGMRASLYNAVPEEAVDALVDFMADFRRRRG